jgi:hypothetical protein
MASSIQIAQPLIQPVGRAVVTNPRSDSLAKRVGYVAALTFFFVLGGVILTKGVIKHKELSENGEGAGWNDLRAVTGLALMIGSLFAMVIDNIGSD